ncbi:HypC/HybG/HupF family hydrogenase formation chaperone [Terasakiella sp. SH-1]|uniref:HypC/HybG/HupF family hydrogenase formation chaperone n=1 Tax=Terasakiella sp. SH-1 TaxID=2560057 RepID=UPI0010735A6B|nr:HypC/HybG/HupF family hydrogenase formation chaperone [Terasakiella sp. SH-1]
MCVGIPMRVLESTLFQALCEDNNGTRHTIDMVLTGEQPAGTWVMTFLGAAREVLDETTAKQIIDALSALEQAMSGNDQLDQYFPDLVQK